MDEPETTPKPDTETERRLTAVLLRGRMEALECNRLHHALDALPKY
jgi:hypothetical protein